MLFSCFGGRRSIRATAWDPNTPMNYRVLWWEHVTMWSPQAMATWVNRTPVAMTCEYFFDTQMIWNYSVDGVRKNNLELERPHCITCSISIPFVSNVLLVKKRGRFDIPHPLPVVIMGHSQTPLWINQPMGIWDIYAIRGLIVKPSSRDLVNSEKPCAPWLDFLVVTGTWLWICGFSPRRKTTIHEHDVSTRSTHFNTSDPSVTVQCGWICRANPKKWYE